MTHFINESKGIGISAVAGKSNGKTIATGGPTATVPVHDKAESTTKSAVAEGKITITKPEQQKQDINELNRNGKDTLNKLDNIFDINKIRETQETAALFSELAFNAIHNMSKKWTKEQKIMAHMAVGYISGELTDSKTAVSVALAAGINKYVIEEISRNPKMKAYYEKNPAELQWLSAALGAAIGGIIDNDAITGANIAISGTRNNYLFIDQIEQKEKEISEAKERGASEEEISAIERKWNEIDYYQDMALDAFGYSGESIDDKQSISKGMQSDIKNHARTLYMLRHANEIAEVIGSFGKMLMQGAGDTAIEKYYAENSSKNVKITPVQVNPNINMVVPIESGGTVIQKKFVKTGILQIADTAYSIYLDAEKYTGTDLTKAVSLDVGSMVISLYGSAMLGKKTDSTFFIILKDSTIGFFTNQSVDEIKKATLGDE